MTERKLPRVENAPGLVWKPLKNGWRAQWQARTDIVRRGYKIKSYRILQISSDEPTHSQQSYISDYCQTLQNEMLVWARGGIVRMLAFDGTWRGLIACYQTDPDSTYRKLRYRTRINYDRLCRRIEGDHGAEQLRDIKARDLLAWHRTWTGEEEHVAMAHGIVGMVRTLCTFGATILEDEECRRIKELLHSMRFKMPTSRKERITAAQADAVRAQAHRMGLHSIALAQAFQFECMLRQKDVIGEWVPLPEPGASEVVSGNEKWLRGLRWSEIGQNLILRHTTSKRSKDIEIDLRLAPMVVEELARMDVMPVSGPVVVAEYTGLPWTDYEFRRQWRIVATAAGVPANVFNMDSRAGGITEATDAGAELEHVRHAATHSDISMTQKYSRGTTEKIAKVMQLRAAYRKQGVNKKAENGS